VTQAVPGNFESTVAHRTGYCVRPYSDTAGPAGHSPRGESAHHTPWAWWARSACTLPYRIPSVEPSPHTFPLPLPSVGQRVRTVTTTHHHTSLYHCGWCYGPKIVPKSLYLCYAFLIFSPQAPFFTLFYVCKIYISP
jgi:hypothetical protein